MLLDRSLEDEEFSEAMLVRDALEKHIESHGLKFFDDVIKNDKTTKQI